MISVTPRLHFGEPSADGVHIDIDTALPNEAAAFILLGMTVLVPDAATARRALAFLMPEDQANSRVDSVINFDVETVPTWQG